MEDARQAEHLLERTHLPHFRAQLCRETTGGLDAAYVSVLHMANKVLALRDSMIRTCDSAACSQERVDKYRGRCKEVIEKFARKLEAKTRENDLADRLLASEVNQNEWKAWFRETENKAAIEHNRSFAAEAKLAVVSSSLASIERRVEELTCQLKDAESRADAAAVEAHATVGRAIAAEMASQEAEQRRVETAAQVWDAGARAEEAESRA